jgi:hypothetical protein
MTITDLPTGPTKERLRQAGEDVEAFTPDENVNFKTIRMLDGSPLEKLATAEKITGDQYNAGSRYFSDWYHSGLAPGGATDYSRDKVDCPGYVDISYERMAAQTRFNRALKAIGAVHAHILDDVLLSDAPLAVYADRFNFVRRRDRSLAALTALRLALDALSEHYNGPRKYKSSISHADNYRPVIK